MKLHAPVGNFRANKILVTAKLVGAQVEFPAFDPKFTESKDFMMLSPLKRLPILQTPEGSLSGSHAALRYLAANNALYSGTAEHLAEIDSWLDDVQNYFEVPLCSWVFPVLGVQDFDVHVYEESVQAVKAFLARVETHLESKPFLAETFSIADISFANSLVFGYRLVLTAAHGSFPAVDSWLNKLLEIPEFREVLGGFRRAVEELKAPPKVEKKKEEGKKGEGKKKEEGKKEESKKEGGKKEGGKKEGGKKEGGKKEGGKKAKEKEAAKPADDEEEDAGPKRGKNPLDDLPPSTFVLDDWKRLYANTKNKREVIGQFWEKYEDQGWSIWLLRYQKAEGEGQVIYMTNNLLSMGFIQRLDGFNFRRYSFGVMGVYGDEPQLEIRGCLMWRGQEVTRELKEHPTFEYYDRVRVDPANPAHRQLVEDYWCSELEQEVEGLKFREKHTYI